MKKTIENFTNYSITTNGECYNNTTGRKLTPTNNGKGYYRYTMTGDDGVSKKRYVHVLVADAFLPKEEGKTEVNHLSKDRSDCRLINLERVTPSGNKAHAKLFATKSNLSKYVGVYFFKGKWVARIAINKVCTYLGRYESELEAYSAYLAVAEKNKTVTKYHYQF